MAAAPPASAPAPTIASTVGNPPFENPSGMRGSTSAGPPPVLAATRGRLQAFLDCTTSAACSRVRALAVVPQVPST
jgi:hypothetical protein